MSFKNYLVLCLLCLSFGTIAQTKMIWHKSHSGSTKTLKLALENNTFKLDWANFGGVARPQIKNAKLDSLIFTKDKKIVMITSEYCKRHKESKEERFWKAGKDTIENHSLFGQNHNLDKIKRVLKTQYNFQNDIDKVVFVGYDNEKNIKKKRKKKKYIPESQTEISPELEKDEVLLPSIDTQNPNNNHSLLIYTLVGIVLIFSLILAWFTRQFSKIKTIK